jgi:hypothetical protein
VVVSLSKRIVGASVPVASVIRAVTVTDAGPLLMSTAFGAKSNATSWGAAVSGSAAEACIAPEDKPTVSREKTRAAMVAALDM